MVLENILGGFGATCGSRVDIPQGGSCKVTFSVKNTGTLSTAIDYMVDVFDSKGAMVGSIVGFDIPLAKGEEKSVTTDAVTIKGNAATGLGSVRVTIIESGTENILDQESCSIVNIITGIAAEITGIAVAKA